MPLNSTLLNGVGPIPNPPIEPQFSFSGFSSIGQLTTLDVPIAEEANINEMFSENFTYNPPVDQSTDNLTPPKKTRKPLKRILPTPCAANASVQNELEETNPPLFIITDITKTQKNGISLIIEQDQLKRKFVLASGGVSKKGVCTWNCVDRKCKSQVKTKFEGNYSNFISEKMVNNKKRFVLNDPLKLEKGHLRPHEQKPVQHTCNPLSRKELYKIRIASEAISLTEQMVSENPVRKLLRSEILSAATDKVLDETNDPTSPLGIKKLNIARRISRCLKKNDKNEADIDEVNKETYEFSDYFQTGQTKLDVEFAKKTQNRFLLFYSFSILSLLATGDYSLIADGTFPMGRKGLYEQLYIGLIVSDKLQQVAFYCWMTHRKQSDYTEILNWVKAKIGGTMRVRAIVTDREVALYSSIRSVFEYEAEQRCCFHGLQNFRKRFHDQGLGELMPAKNKRVSSANETLVAHCWHAVQFAMYMPIGFVGFYIDYLIHRVISVLHYTLQAKLKAALLNIKMEFSNDPNLSWYHAMTKNGEAEYVDPTTNCLERLNGELKNFKRNNVRGRKNITVIAAMKEYIDKDTRHSMVFTHKANTKPSTFIQRRRALLLDIVDMINRGPGKDRTMLSLIQEIDNEIWNFYGFRISQADNDLDDSERALESDNDNSTFDESNDEYGQSDDN